jgi:hypothetical protein
MIRFGSGIAKCAPLPTTLPARDRRDDDRRSLINIEDFPVFHWCQKTFQAIMFSSADRRKQLPDNPQVLQQMVLDLIAQLDAEQARRIKTENLLRQLLAAKKRTQQRTDYRRTTVVFEAELKAQGINIDDLPKDKDSGNGSDDKDQPPSPGNSTATNPRGSPRAARASEARTHVHDLTEEEKHCAVCAQDLREFGEETASVMSTFPRS